MIINTSFHQTKYIKICIKYLWIISSIQPNIWNYRVASPLKIVKSKPSFHLSFIFQRKMFLIRCDINTPSLLSKKLLMIILKISISKFVIFYWSKSVTFSIFHLHAFRFLFLGQISYFWLKLFIIDIFMNICRWFINHHIPSNFKGISDHG